MTSIPYIAIPNNHSFAGGTGFLSSTFGPFELNADPGQSGFKVRDFSIPEGVSLARFHRRRTAREIIEKQIRQLEAEPDHAPTPWVTSTSRAYTLLTSPKAQAAFTLEGETQETMQLYGRDVTGLRGPDGSFHPKRAWRNG